MANVAKIKDLIISSGGSYTIESLSNYKEANITFSVGSIASNLSINPAANAIGTIKGLRFTIHYDGSFVAFGNFTVTIFGTVMNNNLRDKKLLIDLYYDGSNWRVTFTPSYDIIANLLNASPIIYTSSTALATINTAGVQTLTSFNIVKSLFKPGDRYIFKISGRYNGATAKNIVLQINDGTNNLNLWNLPTSYNNKDFYIESIIICTDFNNGYWAKIASSICTLEYPIVVTLPQQTAPVVDFTTNWNIRLYGEEFTPSGNQIQIYNITVEKLLK